MVTLQSYRGISAGDVAILKNGREVVIKGLEVYTSEGASLGIALVHTEGGANIRPSEVKGYLFQKRND